MRMIFLLAIILMACNNKKQAHDFKTSDEMFINVMTDLYLAEQVLRSERTSGDTTKEKYRDQIFAIHGIDDTFLFNDEFRILMNDKLKYQMINDSVIVRLEFLNNKKLLKRDTVK